MVSINVNRTKLIKMLEKVSPALAVNSFLPVLTHYCFDKELGGIVGYDDITAIQINSERYSLLNCAVPSVLLKLLKTIKEDNIELNIDATVLGIVTKDEKHTILINTLSEETFVFQGLDEDSLIDLEVMVDGGFVYGIEILNKVLVEDDINSLQMGTILVCEKGEDLVLYSTDDVTITKIVCDTKFTLTVDRVAVIVPRLLGASLISWFKEIPDTASLCVIEGDSIELVADDYGYIKSKLLYSSEGYGNIENVFSRHLPSSIDNSAYFKVTEELLNFISQASLLGDINIKISNETRNSINLEAETSAGRVVAVIRVSNLHITNFDFEVNLKLVKRAISLADYKTLRMLILETVIVIKNNTFKHIISIEQE